jgi:serine/threonine protein kinase
VSTPDPGAGRRLADRYRLDEVLGRGGTGTVWSAYDEMLRRRVAVKEVLPPPGMPAAEADLLRERTLREARAIATLSHPHVVTLHDVVQQDGEPFVVMELLPSRTLAALIKEHGPLDARGAALVGSAVASALQSAHQAGITHRDVKPGNVLIGDDGRIKLTDFGISRNVAESSLTATGMTLGSPAFMAPEIASGGEVTPAADLWGLGATLFAAVEGRPPYDAGDAVATVAAVVHGEVPVPAAAGPLAPVISGLMVKDPAQRLPLDRVRQMLHPLLPPDDRVLRGDSDGPTMAVPTTKLGPVQDPPAAGKPGQNPPAVSMLGPAQNPLVTSAPLAPHPGPLPFQAPTRPRRRSALATALLTVASIMLFAGGLGAGFALVRVAAGASVWPRPATGSTQPPGPTTPEPPPTLVDQTLTLDQNDPAAAFHLRVPAGWTDYRADLNARPGLSVILVSPDGSRTITVERLAGLYPGGSVNDYLDQLENELRKAFAEHTTPDVRTNGKPRPGASEEPRELTYRTVSAPLAGGDTGGGTRGDTGGGTGGDAGSDAEAGRSTFAQLVPTQHDLWVLKVTVPFEQESAARIELFDEVRRTFDPASP